MKEKVLVFEKSARHRFLRAVVSHFSLHMVSECSDKYKQKCVRSCLRFRGNVFWICARLHFFAPICARFAHFLRDVFERLGLEKKMFIPGELHTFHDK